MNRTNWILKCGAARSLALTGIFLACALTLTGCTGTLYPQDHVAQMPGLNAPSYNVTTLWIVQFLLFVAVLGPAITVISVIAFRPYIFPPFYKARLNGVTIEIWVAERKYPLMAFPDALIVPVAPDLKMVFGAAKIIRDYGGGHIQAEADKVAPLQPGDAFVGSGAKYRWSLTALAVIFDAQKRADPEAMAASLQKAMRLTAAQGATSVMLPDMTENLLAQPNWISDAQKAETAQSAARLTLNALLSARTDIETVKIWVFDPANADAYAAELEKMEDESVLNEDGQLSLPAA